MLDHPGNYENHSWSLPAIPEGFLHVLYAGIMRMSQISLACQQWHLLLVVGQQSSSLNGVTSS